MALIGIVWNKHEKDGDKRDEESKERVTDHQRRFTDHEVRIVKLETRDYVTAIDLRNEVSRAITEVTEIFREDHKQIREDNKAIIGLVNEIVQSMPKRAKKK